MKRKRRKPDYSGWTIWRLHEWAVGGLGEAIGYLVTTGDRFPRPVAFVPDTGAEDFALARSIRDRGNVRKSGRLDVLTLSLRRFPKWMLNLPLIPIGESGQRIRTARAAFEAGMYVGIASIEGFSLITRGSLAMISPLGTPELIEDRRTVREELQRAGDAVGKVWMAAQRSSGEAIGYVVSDRETGRPWAFVGGCDPDVDLARARRIARRPQLASRPEAIDLRTRVPAVLANVPVLQLRLWPAGGDYTETSDSQACESATKRLQEAASASKLDSRLLRLRIAYGPTSTAEIKRPPEAPDIAKLGGNVDVREQESAVA
ncbi:hypothetical protein [Humisphaera borealis]|uniref:Uncharacterized protein n=1 Tax=Humisphaera borealis TaxID=2807512 RepID=A0A7M2WSM0_9BACT|nr:hypothetical protein [Humisphaera borealis]QOV88433.1 hypothetical protein IPV69_19585 [Humisphaera borealis]